MVGVLGQLAQLQVGRAALLICALPGRCARARLGLALLLAAAAAPATAAGAAAGARFEDGRVAMGTLLEVTVEAPDAARARAAAEACFAEVERLEALLSTWRPASDVSRLNAAAGGAALAVHADVRQALEEARALHAATQRTFDVTVGPLVALWTRAGQSGALPSQDEIAAARALVDARGIELDAAGARLAKPGMAVDLGGFAKGFALDRVDAILRARGIERALVSFGQSSLLALGAPEGEDAWRVLLRGPGGDFAGVAQLRDARLSISGSFGKSSVVGGRRLGHVLDPRSGWPVSHEAIAVVRAPTAATAEAFSKALLVLPPDEALATLQAAPGVEGLWMGADGRRETPGFREAVGFVELEAAAPEGPALD